MKWLLAVVAAAVVGAFAPAAGAEDYPNRAIRFISSTPGGSPPDLIARVFAQALSDQVKQPVFVENRPGANGILAVEAAARAAPDGYTFLATTAATLSTNPYLYKNGMLAVTDLVPVSKLIEQDFLIAAHSSLGVRTIGELIAMIKAKPGALNASTTSRGSFAYLAGELIKLNGNLDFVTVAYTGGAASASALARGEVQFTIESPVAVEPLVRDGKAVKLATLGAKRNARFAGVPTVAESGIPGVNVTGWVGLVAPKGTPAAAIATVQAKLAAAVRDEAVRAKVIAMEMAPVVNAPDQFAAEWQAELRLWERVIKTRDIKVE
jgi:tripartite-type tricarboxylate transporter receptor subunit TctC